MVSVAYLDPGNPKSISNHLVNQVGKLKFRESLKKSPSNHLVNQLDEFANLSILSQVATYVNLVETP